MISHLPEMVGTGGGVLFVAFGDMVRSVYLGGV
jgi:hypothetical protein